MSLERIPYAKPDLSGRETELVVDALSSTWISGGPYVERFESGIAQRMNEPLALAVSNGTVALQLALLALGVKPGDEVIVPGFTFVAPANMVLAVGAKLVVADVDPDTWCLDPGSVARLITANTRAVIAVHTYGNVCDMDGLRDAVAGYNIPIIEDAAEALFSTYKGRPAGTIGAVSTTSFHAAKTITTGEGGMVMTADKDLYQRMTLMRDQGMKKDKRYWHEVVGFNFRMTNIQAAIGCAQLERLPEIIGERARIHSAYRNALNGLNSFREQLFTPSVDPLLWAFAGRIVDDAGDIGAVEDRRDKIMGLMLERGIETRPGFYALSSMPPYHCPEQPNARRLAASVISFPTYPALDNDAIFRICAELKRALDMTANSTRRL